jgi:hypothetical protein
MSAKKKGIMSWNQISVHYSPQIYRIYKAKYQPKNFKLRYEYNLEDVDYGLKIMKKGIPSKYFEKDLILVPPNSTDSHVPTKKEINHQHRALELNRFKRT